MPEHYIFGARKTGTLTDDDARGVILAARRQLEKLQQVSTTEILTVLDRMGRSWRDPAYGPRKAALAALPELTGFSPQMVAAELEAIPAVLSRPALETKLRAELGDLDALDAWRKGPSGAGLTRAFPRGVVLHVSSGNVSVGGSLSAVEGLLTKNVNLIKAASDDPYFPILFAESLKEHDPTGVIGESLAVLAWSGRTSNLHKVFQADCDAIVIWGGEEVVHEYRRDLPLRCRLIEYGPRISLAVVGQEVLADPAKAAKALAADVGLWDQSACSSAQVVYVEDASGDGAAVDAFVEALAGALEAFQTEYPMGPLGLPEKAEITKEREMAKAEMAMGQARLVVPERGQHWTIVVESDPTFKVSPLFRTVYVKRVADLADVPALIAPYGPLLQTCGLGVAPARARDLAERLARAGILRCTALGEMTGGFPGEPHDGVYALAELVRWVSLSGDGLDERMEPSEWWSEDELQKQVWAKACSQVETVAVQAALYQERLGSPVIRTVDDWQALPVLSRDDFYAHTPPQGTGLLTQPLSEGHVLRSGGSSGAPKVSVFAYDEYETDMRFAAAGAHAAGMRAGDRVANLFTAGRLYGSFLSMNRMLELLGCLSFPLLSAAPLDEVLDCLVRHEIDTVIGMPSHLMTVLEAAAKLDGLKLRKVFYTGEQFYPQDRAYFKQLLGLETIASIGYGTVDGGPLGYQCPHCTGAVHHVHSLHQFIEIVDPQTLRPVPHGEPGEILLTNLNRHVMPLIRFRLGDAARWVPGPCPCGRATPRLELLGRADGFVIVANANLDYGLVVDIVSRLPELSASVQVIAERRERRDALTVVIEARADDPLRFGDLAEQAWRHLTQSLPLVADALASGELGTLTVTVVAPGSLERHARTGKLVRIIDRRDETPTS